MKKLISIFLIIIATLSLAAFPACKKEEAPGEEPFMYGFIEGDKYDGDQMQKNALTENPVFYVGETSYLFVDYKMPVGEDSETYTVKVTISPVQIVRASIEYASTKASSEEIVGDEYIMTANFTPYDKERQVRLVVMLTPTFNVNINAYIHCKGEILHNGEPTEYCFSSYNLVKHQNSSPVA